MGDEFTKSCKGQHQERHSLTMGTYFLQLGDECIMTGTTWRLMGETHQFINVSAEKVQITIPVLDLDDLMPPDWQNNINNNDTQYVPLNNNDFSNDLMNNMMNQMENTNDNDGYDEVWISHNVAWGTLGIVLCV